MQAASADVAPSEAVGSSVSAVVPARRRVLMITPHFPPDSMAAAHRVRLLAPHLADYGWEPIVLTVDPARYEHPVEPALADLLPRDLRVVRCRAWSASWTRKLWIGDLGLRALWPALSAAAAVMRAESIDAVFITTYPIYTAALGPLLAQRFGTPYVVDLQDPWVGAWGDKVGGGLNGTPDLKSRVTRWIAAQLEPRVLGSAAALTSVSQRTLDDLYERVPQARAKPHAEIPIGGDERDFSVARWTSARDRRFDPSDGAVHVCAVGTLLPLGRDVARAVFAALAQLRARRPEAASRLRLHFFGTSNERGPQPAARALPLARDAGVADLVTEHPGRLDYLDAVRVQLDASALLLLGSSEPHYTASRLFAALLARRPIVAVYHEASSVTTILRQHTRPPSVRSIAFDDQRPVAARIDEISGALEAIADGAAYRPADVDTAALSDFSAKVLAGRLARLLSEVV